jgi:hypothetical protein
VLDELKKIPRQAPAGKILGMTRPETLRLLNYTFTLFVEIIPKFVLMCAYFPETAEEASPPIFGNGKQRLRPSRVVARPFTKV